MGAEGAPNKCKKGGAFGAALLSSSHGGLRPLRALRMHFVRFRLRNVGSLSLFFLEKCEGLSRCLAFMNVMAGCMDIEFAKQNPHPFRFQQLF